MSLFQTLNFIIKHPLAGKNKIRFLRNYFSFQFKQFFKPHPVLHPLTDRSTLFVEKGMTGATGNVYTGLHEFEDMSFLLHFLRKEDLFVDVGANIGSYTILASAHVGCKTIAIEPITKTFDILKKNAAVNGILDKVELKNIGIGSTKRKMNFTSSLDTTNHVALEDELLDTVTVDINTLDETVDPDRVTLMKIDVEGYEIEVVKGASNVLKSPYIKAIIIELNGSSIRYGYSDNAVHESLLKEGFLPFRYFPYERKLMELKSFGKLNTLYLRDLSFTLVRVESGPSFTIQGIKI